MSRKRETNNPELEPRKPPPVFETNYRCCKVCERRIHKTLFKGEDGLVCKGCRCPYKEGSKSIYSEEDH